MSRKFEGIDLMKLYTLGSNNGWNEVLTKCVADRNINELTKLLYQIQVGMDNLAKQKLNTPQIDEWFCRLTRSIEISAKRIIKSRHPMPGDNPLTDSKIKESTHAIKKKRDNELKQFLKQSSF